MVYVFIDESGDLGTGIGCSKHVILSALMVEETKPLKKIIQKMRRTKFKKDLRVFNELKANNLKKEVIIYALGQLNSLATAAIFHMVLEKQKVYSKYLLEDKHKLYNFIAGKLAKNLPLNGLEVEIKIDKSKGKQVLQEDFNEYFKRCLKEKSAVQKIKIEHSYSHAWPGLQFADLIAWAAFQKMERNDSQYIDCLKVKQELYTVW